jgi:Tfp pilus assembly protein PilX
MSGKNEQGFSLILAIFLMVVFALLLTALVQIETASNLISGAQATAERALMAAQSGAQAGVYQIAPGGKRLTSALRSSPSPVPTWQGLPGVRFP